MKGDVELKDMIVFIRVQAPEQVGGPYDHPSWSPSYVASGKKVKSEKKYSMYRCRDDGEDIVVRHLFWNYDFFWL